MSTFAPPVQRLVTELSKLPGIGNRTAQRLAFHILRASARTPRARRGDPRGQGEDRPVRGLLQPRRRAALPHLPGRAPRPRPDLRRRGAERRDPDGAHARVSRRLPRARRRALADRRRRPRGPEDRRAASRASAATGATEDGAVVREVVLATNPTTTGEATALHIAAGPARARSRADASRAWPAACRWARISSTPTRSRSARRSRGAARCSAGAAHASAWLSSRRVRDRRDEVRRHVRRRRRAHQARRRADRRQARSRARAWSPCSRRAARPPTS